MNTLIEFALLRKKCKYEIPTEQKLGASNTKKQLLLCLSVIKRKIDISC